MMRQDTDWLWIGIGATSIVLLIVLIWVVILSMKFSRYRKMVHRLLGDTGVEHLDQVMDHVHHELERQRLEQRLQQEKISQLEQILERVKGNIAVHRYNAFAETGNDLSFSLAMVDANKDGVVISGIHNRDNTFLYAKPLATGESKYALTQEEKLAINLAFQQK